MIRDYEPAEIIDVVNKIYLHFTTKMSSFFVVVTLVLITWWIIRWFLRMLASLAWLVTLAFVMMYLLPALREGKLDDAMLIVGNISYSIFIEAKKLVFKLIKNYMEAATEYLKN